MFKRRHKVFYSKFEQGKQEVRYYAYIPENSKIKFINLIKIIFLHEIASPRVRSSRGLGFVNSQHPSVQGA